jgi:hypothetical protein
MMVGMMVRMAVMMSSTEAHEFPAQIIGNWSYTSVSTSMSTVGERIVEQIVLLRDSRCLVIVSLAPRFSEVTKLNQNVRNRFNGLSGENR